MAPLTTPPPTPTPAKFLGDSLIFPWRAVVSEALALHNVKKKGHWETSKINSDFTSLSELLSQMVADALVDTHQE